MSENREIDKGRFRKHELSGGFVAVAGKTDRDNDFLSLTFREPGDLWFHTCDCPGSHVLLLKSDEREASLEVMKQAAAVAAWYSKLRKRGKVQVGMCPAENVSKRKKAPPGQVIAEYQRTFQVQPLLPDRD